jgi:hypothetical protein
MSRVAILIGSPGAGDDVLPGPAHDIAKLRAYLLSPTGGRWNDDEIIRMDSPTVAALDNALDTANSRHYCFFTFSGHGEHLGDGTVLQLRPGQKTPVEHVLDHLKIRATVVIDACREVIEGAGPAPELPNFDELLAVGAEHQGEYREFFEQEFTRVNEGSKNVLYACRAGQRARDTSTGGVFIQALINEALLWSAGPLNGATGLSVGEVWYMAAKKLIDSGEHQQTKLVPRLEWRRRPPFAVGMPGPQPGASGRQM